jgi:hypothetical protein
VRFSELYKFVLRDSSSSSLPVYNSDDKLVTLKELPQYSDKKRKASDKRVDVAQELEDATTIYRFSATRILDHVYSLLMSKDIWYAFISPRFDGRSTAANIERGKTLQMLSLYCQGLLNYPMHFNFEVFMRSFDSLKRWSTVEPVFGARTNRNLTMLRDHDYFSASVDVNELFNSFEASGQSHFTGPFFLMAGETLGHFGLRSTLDSLSELAEKYTYTDAMTRLESLDSGKYLPLVSSIEVGALDIKRSVARTILLSKTVETEVEATLDVLLSFIGRNTSPEVIGRFKKLSVHAPFPLTAPTATSFEPATGTAMHVTDGVISLDSAAPIFSRAYMDYLREYFMNKMFTANIVTKDYEFREPRQIINFDKVARIRDIVGHDFKTLMPNHMSFADYTYKVDDLSANSEQFRDLIAKLTGRPYQLAMLELQVARVRTLWATSFSAFACMFVDEAVLDVNASVKDVIAKPDEATLVVGMGHPYGTDYIKLNSMQFKDGQDDREFFPLIPGVWLKFHHKIPVVQASLVKVSSQFYNHADLMFQSNGEFENVRGWNISEGMWNHALVPINLVTSVPPLVFTDTFVYLNNDLYVHAERGYRPSSAAKAREDMRLHITEHSWPYNKVQPYIQYLTLGEYSTATEPSEELPDEKIAEIVTKIDEANDRSIAEAHAAASSITDQAARAEETIATEVNKLNPPTTIKEDHRL